MNKKDTVEKWFIFANNDLKVAEFLLDMKPLPIEIICYHCNQSAKKYLKGYIEINEGNALMNIKLTELNKLCCDYNEEFNQLKSDCEALEIYDEYSTCPMNINIEQYDNMKQALVSAHNIEMFINKIFESKIVK